MPNTLAVGNMHVHVADHATHGQQCLVYWLPITDTSMKLCISSTQSVMPGTLAPNSVVTFGYCTPGTGCWHLEKPTNRIQLPCTNPQVAASTSRLQSILKCHGYVLRSKGGAVNPPCIRMDALQCPLPQVLIIGTPIANGASELLMLSSLSCMVPAYCKMEPWAQCWNGAPTLPGRKKANKPTFCVLECT